MKQYLILPRLPLPAVTTHTHAQPAEYAYADCATGFNEMGLIVINNITGSQQDAEHAIAQKANEQGASWYRIVQMYEDKQLDNWWVQAILYT